MGLNQPAWKVPLTLRNFERQAILKGDNSHVFPGREAAISRYSSQSSVAVPESRLDIDFGAGDVPSVASANGGHHFRQKLINLLGCSTHKVAAIQGGSQIDFRE